MNSDPAPVALRRYRPCVLLLLMLSTTMASEGEALRLTLHAAMPVPDDVQDRSAVEVEGRWSDGSLYGPLRCTARSYNAGSHRANWTKAAAGQGRLLIALGADCWRPAATMDVQVQLDAAAATGTYRGTVTFADRDLTVAVVGQVTGQRMHPWPETIPGHRPVAAREHPRLIVRRQALTDWRQQAADGIGRRLSAAVGGTGDGAGETKFATWAAAIAGQAYLLTGDGRHAERARRIVAAVVFDPAGRQRQRRGLRQDIHYGPFLLGLALAYDACFDAWDPAFRQRVADEIHRRCRQLHHGTLDGTVTGRRMSGLNCYVWSNHNAIRTSCMGVGALAILGDGDYPDCIDLIERAALDLRDYMRTGLGDSGMCMEGHFYKHMTMRRGVVQFLHAYRQVLGGDLLGGPLGDWYCAGEFHNRQLIGERTGGPGDAFWAGLFLTASAEHMPVYRHWWEEAGAPLGSALLAPYTVANLPAVAPRPVAADYPWWLPDRRKAFDLFRVFPTTAADVRVLMNLKNDIRRACHYERAGDWPSVDLIAFDRVWLHGRAFPYLPVKPEAYNVVHGPTVSRRHQPAPRVAEIDIDLRNHYLQVLDESAVFERQQAQAAGATEDALPHWGRLVYDHGIRGTRSMIIDLSGASGAPVLIAWLDILDNVPDPPPAEAEEPPPADMPPVLRQRLDVQREHDDPASYLPLALPEDLRAAATIEGDSLHCVVDAGASLRLWAVDGRWQDGQARLVSDTHRYLVVLTVQQGAAPPFERDGPVGQEGLQIGDRLIAVRDGHLRVVPDEE